MELNPQSVAAYTELMSNPAANGLKFKPLSQIFSPSEEIIPKHILFKQYIDLIKAPVPKLMFYIIMDDLYGYTTGKTENGDLGYALKINTDEQAGT